MEVKVSWSAKVKPLFHCGKDDERIIFCRPPLIWKEAVAFPHLFLEEPRDLEPSVLEVYKVDVEALLERAAFFFVPFSGVPLSTAPACWDRPLEGIRRILFRPCADQDADF